MDADKIEYFIKETNKKFDKIDEKMDKLLSFKWQIVGGSVAFSLIATGIIQLAALVLNK